MAPVVAENAVGDAVQFIQAKTSTRAAGSDLSDLQAAARGQLGSFLESREVQDLMKEHSRSDEDMAEDLRSLTQALRVSKETEARLELEAQHAPAALVAPPPEVELLKEDMRAALRQLAPDPAQVLMLLNQPRTGRNLTLPQEEQDLMSEQIARLSKSFQADTALHEELLARIPHLHGLLADGWFLEPLWAAGNASAGRELRGRELADRLPELAGRGVAALKSVRMEGGGAEQEPAPAPPPPTSDPYLNIVTGHSVKWTPKSKSGCAYQLQVGANKKFFTSKLKPSWSDNLKGFFINPSLTLACAFESGVGISATFQLNIMDPPPAPVGAGPEGFPTLRFFALALGITSGPEITPTSESGYSVGYGMAAAVGGGLKQPIPPAKAFLVTSPDLLVDMVHTFDFASGKADTPGGGWKYGVSTAFALVAGPKVEKAGTTLAKLICSTKTVYAPSRASPSIGIKFVRSAGGPR